VDQVLFNNKGCSSEIAVFYENGPFKVVNNKLKKNKYSWNRIANLLYLDFPSSIGFS
jgi:serine carboxypeptidase-like clade 4